MARARGVLGSTPSNCQFFHSTLVLPHNIRVYFTLVQELNMLEHSVPQRSRIVGGWWWYAEVENCGGLVVVRRD